MRTAVKTVQTISSCGPTLISLDKNVKLMPSQMDRVTPFPGTSWSISNVLSVPQVTPWLLPSNTCLQKGAEHSWYTKRLAVGLNMWG